MIYAFQREEQMLMNDDVGGGLLNYVKLIPFSFIFERQIPNPNRIFEINNSQSLL